MASEEKPWIGKRTAFIGIKVTPAEHEELRQVAADMRTSVSQALMRIYHESRGRKLKTS